MWKTVNSKLRGCEFNLIPHQRLIKGNNAGAICVATDLENIEWELFAFHLEAWLKLAAGEQHTFHVVFGIGTETEAEENCARLLEQPERLTRQARAARAEKTRDMFARVPRLQTNHRKLRRFYHCALHTRNSAFRNKHLTKPLMRSVTRRCHA
jgi:hypothetical protein